MRYPNIAAERARAGMNMEEFSVRLGVSRKTVYNWEQKGSIPLSALEKMSEIFGCTVDYLLGRDSA